MPDEIIGTAVLQKQDGEEFLHVVCHTNSNGRNEKFHVHIPVSEQTPENAAKRGWKYKKERGVLTVQPSLRVFQNDGKTERFHNGGLWTIPYQEFDLVSEESPLGYSSAMRQLAAINP